jgi:hypothetical protein
VTPHEIAILYLASAVHTCHAERPHNKAGYSHDAIFRLIDEIAQTEKIATWMVFAMQLVIDAQRVIKGDDATRSFDTWETTSEDIQESLKQSMQYTPDRIGIRDLCYRKILDPLNDIIARRTGSDEYRALMLAKWPNDYVWNEVHGLRKLHIMHSGLQLAEFRTLVSRNSRQLVFEEQKVVPMVAHLYNAARRSGKLSTAVKWEDLEFSIEQHEQRNLLHLLTDSQGSTRWVKDYLLAIGCDPRAAASADTPDGIESVLGAPSRTKNALKPTTPLPKHKPFAKTITDAVSNYLVNTQPPPSSSASATPLLSTPLHTLNLFKSAMQARDDLTLSFNLLGFDTQCRYLLRHIQNICLASTETISESLTGDAKLPAIIGVLLLHLETPSSLPLRFDGQGVWTLLDEHVGQHGSEFLDKTKKKRERETSPDVGDGGGKGDQGGEGDADEGDGESTSPNERDKGEDGLVSSHHHKTMHLDALHSPGDLLTPTDRAKF